MKKLISLFILLFMAMSVYGQVSPAPIVGQLEINGVRPTGYHIEVKNLDNPDAEVLTSDKVSSLVTERGKFMADLNDFGRDNGEPRFQGYIDTRYVKYAGDRIQVKIVKDGKGNDFSCSQCIYTFNVPKSFPYYFDINIQDAAVKVVEKPVVIEKTCREVGCSNGYNCNYDSGVCEKETTTVEKEVKIYCADGKEVTDKNECLETKEQVLGYTKTQLGIAVGITAGFAALVVYYIGKRKRARAEKMLKTRIENIKKKKK